MSNCCQPFNPLTPNINCGTSFSDSVQYFEDIEELRQYIIDRESTRKLEDLVNVEAGIGSYSEGLILGFDVTTQLWSVVESFEPITF